MEHLVSARHFSAWVLALVCLAPVSVGAQSANPPPAPAAATAADQSRMWVVLGGTATTLRGDCQEDCPAHGTGDYLHTGSVIGIAGYRLNRQMDAGVEVSWVPANLRSGDDARSTFVMGAAQFKPWAARGFFLKAAVGMVFVRNFPYDGSGTLPPATSKGLGFSYGAGWAVRQHERVGVQFFGAQHVAALGDFTTGNTTINDIIGNYWSVGAALVIR
jgi:hypothetical protein